MMNSSSVSLDLGVEELEELEVPGFWEWAAGVAVGVALGAAAVWIT